MSPTTDQTWDRERSVDEYLRGEVPALAMICCPFHDDTTASARVLPGSGSLHCFVCGYTLTPVGVAAHLIAEPVGSEPSGRDYAFAERYLEHIGHRWTEESPGDRPGSSPRRGGGHLAAAPPPPPPPIVYRAMTEFARLARGRLAAQPAVAGALARARGVRDPVALGLGLAAPELVPRLEHRLDELVPGWRDDPEAHLATLITAGIFAPARAVAGGTGTRPARYRLRDRLILPEWRRLPEPDGPTVVFYQARRRVDAGPDPTPKYLSPNLPRQLWGVETLRRQTPVVWVCEGVFDALPLAEAGEAVLATLGIDLGRWGQTALQQAIGARPVVLAYDNDRPGIARAAQLQERLQAAGLRVLTLAAPEPHKDLSDWTASVGVAPVIGAAYLRL